MKENWKPKVRVRARIKLAPCYPDFEAWEFEDELMENIGTMLDKWYKDKVCWYVVRVRDYNDLRIYDMIFDFKNHQMKTPSLLDRLKRASFKGVVFLERTKNMKGIY